MIYKIGFGGGCHWCTEAVFASLKGVVKVQQGWIVATGDDDSFSEAVVVEYDPAIIPLAVLAEIHIYTHASTSQHSMRSKYRSAIYTFNAVDAEVAQLALQELQQDFDETIITKVLPFGQFRLNIDEQLNYYYTDPQRPFCQTYINPKLKLLMEKFSLYADKAKIKLHKS